jgi:glutathione synthase/RimK-type ligase-like ATP-grasp enzyme
MLADAGDLPRAMDELGLPLVVKIPDGSFSRGVHKVQTPEEFRRIADELFEETDLLLAQKFLPTEFDWRVGVLAGEPLFVCQYRMARGHWQIVKHRPDGSAREGGFRTFELDKAPPQLIDIAVRAARRSGTASTASTSRRPTRLHRHGGQRQPQPRARHRGPGRQGRDLGPAAQVVHRAVRAVV